MPIFVLTSLLVPLATQTAPINLGRVFSVGEKQVYRIDAHLTSEIRGGELRTWMPEDLDLNYTFTTHVSALKADGIAVLRYTRPTMTEIAGETETSGPKTKTIKVNADFNLTVSPINEILEQKSVTKPTAPKKVGAKWRFANMSPAQGDLFGTFIGEVYRLSVFIGPLQSGLDFAPRLPFEAVKVGDTWKRTVGYQPQELKGKGGKQAVQRLDYEYTYKGPITVNGKKFLRVQAKLNLDTDLAEFANQLLESTSDDTGLAKFPLKLKGTIDFDLDPKTHHCLMAQATSEGGFQLFITDKEEPVVEQRLKGRTTFKMVSSKIEKPTK